MSEVSTPRLNGKKIAVFKKMQLYIAYLQETHLLSPEIEKWNVLGWKVLAAASLTSKARGVVILVKFGLAPTLHSTTMDSQWKYVIADATTGLSRFVMCNHYASNTYSKDFFMHILNKLYLFRNKLMLLGGDGQILLSSFHDSCPESGNPLYNQATTSDRYVENRTPARERFYMHFCSPRYNV